VGLRFTIHKPLIARELIPAIIHWHDVNEHDVLGLRIQATHPHANAREHATPPLRYDHLGAEASELPPQLRVLHVDLDVGIRPHRRRIPEVDAVAVDGGTNWTSHLRLRLNASDGTLGKGVGGSLPGNGNFGADFQRWVIAIFKKKSITNYITNYFYAKLLALSIGLKKPITQLPITKTKKCRYAYMYGRELSLISFKIY